MSVADKDELRFSMAAEKYLEQHDVLVYLEDAVSQLLEHKEENPKVNPSKFFSEYFTSVKEGNHILFREYSYINATIHNRSSFVRNVWKCFRHVGRKGDLLSIREYHSLVSLLCPDFPFQPLQKTARIILMEDAMDSLISFPDFLYAFQIQFCYNEFLSECAGVFTSLLNSSLNVNEPVFVPTSENGTKASPRAGEGSSDAGHTAEPTSTVDATQLLRALSTVTDKMKKEAPQQNVLREVLAGTKKTTFYGFLMALAKSESLNNAIGKLPNKADLLDVSDQELTSSLPNSKPALSSETSIGSQGNLFVMPSIRQCSGQDQQASVGSRTSLLSRSDSSTTEANKTPGAKSRPLPSLAALRKQLQSNTKRASTTKTEGQEAGDSDTDDSSDT